MRCLALAQAWRRNGGQAAFAAAEITPALEARLWKDGFERVQLAVKPGEVEDAACTAELAHTRNVAWVVVDGYHFGVAFQRALKAARLHLLFVDDYGHAGEYDADFVLNQNLTADAALYAHRSPHTRLLLGTRYALLREEFLRWKDWRREIAPVARKVLVTLGGADLDNVTGKLIRALAGFADVETVVVVGGSNPHLEKLNAEIRPAATARQRGENPKSKIRLVVDATNMPELMAWADVAVAAAGSTSWELAFMGLPAVVMVLAENQVGIAAALEREGVSVNLRAHKGVTIEKITGALQSLFADPSRRHTMSRRGRALVDGLGGERVSDRLTECETKSTTSTSSSGKQDNVLAPHSKRFKS